MRKCFVLLVAVSFLAGCSGNTKKNDKVQQAASTERSVESISLSLSEISGVYKGTLPAASSPGIKTELTLSENKTFILVSEFMEEKDGLFTEEGTYTIENGILVATSNGGTILYFKPEDNRLRMLNQDKKEITGELAECYVLKKGK